MPLLLCWRSEKLLRTFKCHDQNQTWSLKSVQVALSLDFILDFQLCVVDPGWSDDTEINLFLCLCCCCPLSMAISIIPFPLIHHKRHKLTVLKIFWISVSKNYCTIRKHFEGFQLTLSISILFQEVTQKVGLKVWLLWKNCASFCHSNWHHHFISWFFVKNLCSKFCATRWIEGEAVATRAILVWDVVKIVAYWESLCKSKQWKCKSYDVLVCTYKDKLMVAKLLFFKNVAVILKGYLVVFQKQITWCFHF